VPSAFQTTTATFTRSWVYTFRVTLTDPANLTATSQVTVTVGAVVSTITVTPSSATVPDGGILQFTATALDQFNQALPSQRTFTWSIDSPGLGVISSGGQYTAPASGAGPATIRARSGAVSGTANITIAQESVSITMFPIPTANSYPMGIVSGPDGNLWFTESQPSKIGRITLAGVVTEYQLPPPLPQNDASTRGPTAITLGPDGDLWFTEAFGPYNSIGKINPWNGSVTEFVIPTVNSGPLSITLGPDGNLWFSETLAHKIGRINPWSGTITEFSISGSPNSIATGSDGNLWFTESHTNSIRRINPWTGIVTEYVVPIDPYSSCGGITAVGANMWFTVTGYGIGRLDPGTGAVTEFAAAAVPVFWGTPLNLTRGPDGNIWFGTLWGSDVVGRITPAGVFNQYVVSSANFNVEALTSGPDGNVWFVEDPGRIGRISRRDMGPRQGPLPTSPNPPAPATGTRFDPTAAAALSLAMPIAGSTTLGAGPAAALWGSAGNQSLVTVPRPDATASSRAKVVDSVSGQGLHRESLARPRLANPGNIGLEVADVVFADLSWLEARTSSHHQGLSTAA
jgi:streptogramin lyase